MLTPSPISPSPLRPPLPVAKRLNRNALLVLAIILGLTTIVVVVTMQPRTDTPQQTSEPPRPGVPEFLQQPVPTPQVTTGGDAARDDMWNLDLDDHEALTPSTGSPLLASPVDSPWSDLTAPATAPPLQQASPTPRALAYQRAMQSDPVTPDGAPPPMANPSLSQRPPSANAEEAPVSDTLWREALAAVMMTPEISRTLSPTLSVASPSVRPISVAQPASPTTSPAAQLITPTSPYIINAGTVLSGLLVTNVISDLPGEILGQVSYDVYDSPTQQHLLIPKGTKLIGTYDHSVALGQQRLLVSWTQLIFPDGRSFPLPELRMSDAQGAAGIQDQVDRHFSRLFGHALALSAISAGVQLSQPPSSITLTTPPSMGQTAAGALGQELGTLSTEMMRRNLDIRPTITIRAGMPFTILLRGDVIFPVPYRSTTP